LSQLHAPASAKGLRTVSARRRSALSRRTCSGADLARDALGIAACLTAPTARHQAAMAGAAPPSLADDLTSGEEAPSWLSSLPRAILVEMMRMMPLNDRARAACVCSTLRDAAADPSLWLALRFDDGFSLALNDARLALLCARAGAALRELRLDAPRFACRAVTAAGVIAALRAGGCAGVQRLTCSRSMWKALAESFMSAEQAQQLAAACPALEHTACCVDVASADDVATACALPGPLSLFVYGPQDAARAALQLPAQMAGLAMQYCYPDAACVAAFCEALRTNTTLTALSLWNCGIDDAGAAALANALRTNTTLTELDLRHNRIGDGGAAALADMLRTNTTLKVLDLLGNMVGDTGAAALGNALRTNATLTTLDLEENEIGAAGAASLGEALRTNTTLTELKFNGGNMVGGGLV